MTADLTTQVRTAIATLGPMVENPVITNTPESRVLFDMLHLTDDEVVLRHWDLPLSEALLLLTGAVDGAHYVMQLSRLADERGRRARRRRR
jgi:hypothetical protein